MARFSVHRVLDEANKSLSLFLIAYPLISSHNYLIVDPYTLIYDWLLGKFTRIYTIIFSSDTRKLCIVLRSVDYPDQLRVITLFSLLF